MSEAWAQTKHVSFTWRRKGEWLLITCPENNIRMRSEVYMR